MLTPANDRYYWIANDPNYWIDAPEVLPSKSLLSIAIVKAYSQVMDHSE